MTVTRKKARYCSAWLDGVYRINRTPNGKVAGMLKSLGMVA